MRRFETQLRELLQKVVLMGSWAEWMVEASVRSLLARDEKLAADLVEKEQQVNALQVEIDEQAVQFAVLNQPVATDARFIFMASRIGGELERVGDQAINIAENARYVLEFPAAQIAELPTMAQTAQRMLHNAVQALADQSVVLANQVLEEEKQVDAFRDTLFRAMLAQLQTDPSLAQRALSLILISRNLERVGDHATNIAEEVIYWIQGRDIRHGKAGA
jgi:phosphate transport system protein